MQIAIKLLFIGLFFVFASLSVASQDEAKKADSTKVEKKEVETAEFKVSGVCKMCTKRIENAALIKGVKFVEWKKETQMLKAIYKTKDVTEDAIHMAVAEIGHDTEKLKATDESYNKLPKCCRYRDGVKVH